MLAKVKRHQEHFEAVVTNNADYISLGEEEYSPSVWDILISSPSTIISISSHPRPRSHSTTYPSPSDNRGNMMANNNNKARKDTRHVSWSPPSQPVRYCQYNYDDEASTEPLLGWRLHEEDGDEDGPHRMISFPELPEEPSIFCLPGMKSVCGKVFSCFGRNM
jgi:hypothetical protein